MKSKIHAACGGMAMAMIALFWTSTAVSELFMSHASVIMVKTGILYAIGALIPLMAITGGTGMALAKNRQGAILDRKRKRMPFIAVNGLFILIPCAIFLYSKAVAGEFDTAFYTVQLLELAAGLFNFSLLLRSLIDGMKLNTAGK